MAIAAVLDPCSLFLSIGTTSYTQEDKASHNLTSRSSMIIQSALWRRPRTSWMSKGRSAGSFSSSRTITKKEQGFAIHKLRV
jgi:hypothetical protein